MDERVYWLGFSVFPGIGPKRFSLLLQHFGSAQTVWEADTINLEKVIGKVLTAQFAIFRKTFNFGVYTKKLQEKQVSFLTLQDEFYPELLKQISNPPFVLYVKGDLRLNDSNHFISIVGTRKITSYGRDVTEQITGDLVAAGFVIVSGLAYGVDACAHAAAIENNGKTIAVLGCGVDCCYPRSNERIYDKIIADSGAVVSEFPPGMQPSVGSFPSRNRIIAGLSQAVVVTEGAEDSGALYTASDAASLGRPVFAVPGPITSQLSKGPNTLIAKGAKLVTSAEDILRELGSTHSASSGQAGTTGRRQVTGDTKEEQIIIALLQNEQLHFDELVRKTSMLSSQLGVILSMMEMKGIVISLNSGIFKLAS